MEEKLDKTKMLFVIISKNEIEKQQYEKVLEGLVFSIPVGLGDFTLDFLSIAREEGEPLGVTCNRIRKSNNAKYKIFLTKPVTKFDGSLTSYMVIKFFESPIEGIIGIYGSEMPISGDYTQAKNFYGSYSYKDAFGDVQKYSGKVPIYYQSVHMIDSGFFVTSGDIPFDEELNDDFVMAAQCCRYRQAGYGVSVVNYEDDKLIFWEDDCIYNLNNASTDYKDQLKIFTEKYKDIVTPLVSVCIPTYNQPFFLAMAIQSVMNQTYKNIELIIGDDSTNEDTKKTMDYYLERYDNIKYFYHGGPLGGKGSKNTVFILSKASGEYVNVLFHDDLIVADKISRMMEYFIRDLEGRISLVMSARMLVNEQNEIITKMNPWQPHEDTILNGEETARKILFTSRNFLGEMSTSLCKKSVFLTKNPETDKIIFDIGVFCGVKDMAYGDVGTWLNALKSGGQCVYIKDCLSAFRSHAAQNTHDPYIRLRLPLEMMGYINIAWLNNLYLHNFDEYKACCSNWYYAFDVSYLDHDDDSESADRKFLKNTLREMRKFVSNGKYHRLLDCTIRFFLNTLPEKNAIRPLVKKNKKTGLWEKADDGIMWHGDQRC